MNEDFKINCYSDGEGSFMKWGQELRAKFLGPFLRILGAHGVSAGHITFLSLLSGLLFCPLFTVENYLFAFVFLILHVLLDGIDGPLARHLGKAGDRGSFSDTAADQLVVTATTITLIHTNFISAWAGCLYLFFYTVVVGFAFVRNALETPYSWLLRPRFLVFSWIAVELWLWENSLEYLLWISATLLALKAVTGFLSIARRIE